MMYFFKTLACFNLLKVQVLHMLCTLKLKGVLHFPLKMTLSDVVVWVCCVPLVPGQPSAALCGPRPGLRAGAAARSRCPSPPFPQESALALREGERRFYRVIIS